MVTMHYQDHRHYQTNFRSYILGFVKQLVMIGAGVKEDELQVFIIFLLLCPRHL